MNVIFSTKINPREASIHRINKLTCQNSILGHNQEVDIMGNAMYNVHSRFNLKFVNNAWIHINISAKYEARLGENKWV